MLQTRDIRLPLVKGEHLMGRGRTPAPISPPGIRGGGGVKMGRRESNSQPHTLRPGSSEKHALGTLGTQWGAQACATQLDAHRHWEGGARCPRQVLARARGVSRQMPGSPVRSLWDTGLPFSGLVGDRSRRGSRAGRGRRDGRGPHSTLQQLMQPFWEP